MRDAGPRVAHSTADRCPTARCPRSGTSNEPSDVGAAPMRRRGSRGAFEVGHTTSGSGPLPALRSASAAPAGSRPPGTGPREHEIHPDSRRRILRLTLHGQRLFQDGVDEFGGRHLGQLTQVAGSEPTSGHRELAGHGRQSRRQGTMTYRQRSSVSGRRLGGLPAPTGLHRHVTFDVARPTNSLATSTNALTTGGRLLTRASVWLPVIMKVAPLGGVTVAKTSEGHRGGGRGVVGSERYRAGCRSTWRVHRRSHSPRASASEARCTRR